MRYLLLILPLLLLPVRATQAADVSVGVGVNLPGVSIGINIPAYPQLVAVPGYPVYYAPSVGYNLFFYDGLYWVFIGDSWYASSWYNGPWDLVQPDYVPLYLLRVPVRYYHHPPPYFRGWHRDAPPHWGEHWGPQWQERHRDWDHWNRRATPRSAPLPSYQRRYYGERYPQQMERQRTIRSERYRYQPREEFTRRHYEGRGMPGPNGGPGRGRRGDDR
jgi:hypothetical protein